MGHIAGVMMQTMKSDTYRSHSGIDPERMIAISQNIATKFKALYATASNNDFEKSRRSEGTNRSYILSEMNPGTKNIRNKASVCSLSKSFSIAAVGRGWTHAAIIVELNKFSPAQY